MIRTMKNVLLMQIFSFNLSRIRIERLLAITKTDAKKKTINNIEVLMEYQREVHLIAKARELYGKQQYSKAMMVLEEMIQLNSRNIEAYFYMANIFHIKG